MRGRKDCPVGVVSAFTWYNKNVTVEPASEKADLSRKSNGFVALRSPDGSHAQIGMKPNGLSASTTCRLLSVCGARDMSLGRLVVPCHPSYRIRHKSVLETIKDTGKARCKPPALARGMVTIVTGRFLVASTN